jgi:hypothetical protein
MNPYSILSSALATHEATALSARLSAWHDAMVAHERRLRSVRGEPCHDECPHAEARALWSEARAAFGVRAEELTFLRSRAQEARGASGSRAPAAARSNPVSASGVL